METFHIKIRVKRSICMAHTNFKAGVYKLPEEEADPERRDDWSEVQNYIKAMNFSVH